MFVRTSHELSAQGVIFIMIEVEVGVWMDTCSAQHSFVTAC